MSTETKQENDDKPMSPGGRTAAACSSSMRLGMHEIVDGWTYVGWIENYPIAHGLLGIDFEKLKARALISDHGEIRKLEPRPGGGVNCFLRETNV